jgi:hypothetical protein
MKKQMFQLASLFLFAVFAVTFVHAQARITVKVPFNFLISDRTFSAGQYSVSSSRNQLTVQDSTGKTIFLGIANPVSGRHVDETGQIVFHCYDNRCFLSEFWTPTRDEGNQLLPSRYEVEVAKYRERTEFALLQESQKR